MIFEFLKDKIFSSNGCNTVKAKKGENHFVPENLVDGYKKLKLIKKAKEIKIDKPKIDEDTPSAKDFKETYDQLVIDLEDFEAEKLKLETLEVERLKTFKENEEALEAEKEAFQKDIEALELEKEKFETFKKEELELLGKDPKVKDKKKDTGK